MPAVGVVAEVSAAEFVAEAERRFMHDAEFHARVRRAVDAVAATVPNGLSERADRSLVTYGAICGLAMAEHDAATGERLT